jgi:hypothetical protein
MDLRKHDPLPSAGAHRRRGAAPPAEPNQVVNKRQQKDIGDEMLRLWLEANRMSAHENADRRVD